jgi:SAM-dependent methyltransferase
MHTSLKPLLLFVLIIFNAPDVFAQDNRSKSSENAIYAFQTPSRDGIGKVYMGREIAQVMSFHGASWLERDSRPKEENTQIAIKNLPINENSVVADIGAGTGYYTFRIAPLVPDGKVYAVEIQDDAIDFIIERSKANNHENVVAVKGSEKSPNLPENSCDLIIMVDVYHELSYPHEMLQEIKGSLKPDGKLLLIEYRGEDPKVAIKPLHKMTVKQVEIELEANGLHLVQNGQFMNIQHFLVFEKD